MLCDSCSLSSVISFSYSLSSPAACWADAVVHSCVFVAFIRSVGLPWAAGSAFPYKTVTRCESTRDSQSGQLQLCERGLGDFDARHKLVSERLKALEAQGLKVCEEE